METRVLRHRFTTNFAKAKPPGRILLSFIMLVLATLVHSCDNTESPLETPSPDIYIVFGHQEGLKIAEPSVTFQWEGSNRLVNEFSYRFMPEQENWSEWVTDTTVTLDYLGQGEYTFEIKGRYERGRESEASERRTFTVDIPGPGILLRPFKHIVVLGEDFNIELLVDDVRDMMFAHFVLKFDTAQLEALEVISGESFQDQPPAFFTTIDNFSGSVDVSMSTIGAEPPRVNGTAVIAVVRFKPLLAEESKIYIDNRSEFRDSRGNPIDTISRIGSIVEVTEQTP